MLPKCGFESMTYRWQALISTTVCKAVMYFIFSTLRFPMQLLSKWTTVSSGNSNQNRHQGHGKPLSWIIVTDDLIIDSRRASPTFLSSSFLSFLCLFIPYHDANATDECIHIHSEHLPTDRCSIQYYCYVIFVLYLLYCIMFIVFYT